MDCQRKERQTWHQPSENYFWQHHQHGRSSKAVLYFFNLLQISKLKQPEYYHGEQENRKHSELPNLPREIYNSIGTFRASIKGAIQMIITL